MRRAQVSALLALVLMAVPAARGDADGPPWTSADVHAAAARVDARTRCIVAYEIGGGPYSPERQYNPYRVSDDGVFWGPAQFLHGDVLERDFLGMSTETALSIGVPEIHAHGPRDVFNPFQVFPWMQWMIAHGYEHNWPRASRLC